MNVGETMVKLAADKESLAHEVSWVSLDPTYVWIFLVSIHRSHEARSREARGMPLAYLRLLHLTTTGTIQTFIERNQLRNENAVLKNTVSSHAL